MKFRSLELGSRNSGSGSLRTSYKLVRRWCSDPPGGGALPSGAQVLVSTRVSIRVDHVAVPYYKALGFRVSGLKL